MRIIVFAILIVLGCGSPPRAVQVSQALPSAIVYKTKKNWNRCVPIGLSQDRREIISYPSPSDVSARGTGSEPTPLVDGYLLDNMGIGTNVAFISLTFSAYGNLSQAPDLEAMTRMIVEKEPVAEMWNLGVRSQFRSTEDINRVIRSGFKGAVPLITDGKLVK